MKINAIGADYAASRALSVKKAKEIQESTPNSIIVGQFENPANPDAHRISTAREILADIGEGSVDGFCSGIGTGGTVTGIGEVLKEELAVATKTEREEVHLSN